MRVRPCGYFPRFQSPIGVIRQSIGGKQENARWLTGLSRTRQAHWWRALKRRIAAFFGHAFRATMTQGFDRLQALRQVPVSRVI